MEHRTGFEPVLRGFAVRHLASRSSVLLERGTGFEPVSSDWQSDILAAVRTPQDFGASSES